MDLSHFVTRSQKGNEDAGAELLKRVTPLVYARAFRAIQDYAAAEDVAQDALPAMFSMRM